MRISGRQQRDLRDDLAIMVSGGRVRAKMLGYAATAAELVTRDQIYSAMVIYGLLTYEDVAGEDKFDQMLLSNESFGYISRLARESERMLKATLVGDTKAHSCKVEALEG